MDRVTLDTADVVKAASALFCEAERCHVLGQAHLAALLAGRALPLYCAISGAVERIAGKHHVSPWQSDIDKLQAIVDAAPKTEG